MAWVGGNAKDGTQGYFTNTGAQPLQRVNAAPAAAAPAATTTPTTTQAPPLYQQTNTHAPLGSVNYGQNYINNAGDTTKLTVDPSNSSQFGQNYLRPGLNQALSYLNQGVGFNPYTDPRVAGFTDQQNQYFGQVNDQFGGQPGYSQAAQNAIGGVASSGGLAPGVQGNLGSLDAISTGQNGINTGQQFGNIANNPLNALQTGAGNFYQGAQNNGFGPSYSEQNLNGVASGSELNGSDPFFQRALQSQLEDIQNRVNGSFSGAGRYGSGANTNVLANELGDVSARALSQNYQFEAGRQLQANQLLDQQRNQDIQNRFTGAAGAANIGQNSIQNQLSGLQGQTGVQQQNIANQANAATAGLQGRFGAQADALRAAALAPGQQQSEIARLQQLLSSGTIQQSQQQDEINAARDLFNEQQQAPWERLAAYQNAIGQPQSGSVTPQQQPKGPSTAQSILGGALTGASIGGSFGYGGLGALAGGVLGGLF